MVSADLAGGAGRMGLVALALAAASLVVWLRPARTEGAVYVRRIAGTMLAVAALVLGGFALGLHGIGQ